MIPEEQTAARRTGATGIEIVSASVATDLLEQSGKPSAVPQNSIVRKLLHNPLWQHLPILLIFLVACYLITLNVGTPWQSFHEDNGLTFQGIALNHIRFGLGYTKGQDIKDKLTNLMLQPPGTHSKSDVFNYFLYGPEQPVVYGDHPPLLGLTIAGSFLTFGYHYWAERLVVIIYALLGLLVFYYLVRRYFDLSIACVAAGLFATFPIFAYYGRNVAHEAPVLFWGLTLLAGYLGWRETGARRWLAVMPVAVVIGGFYGWPMYYLVAILFAVDWASRRRPSRVLALATLLPAVITFALVIAQIDWALGGSLASLKDIFLLRIKGGGEHYRISTYAWLQRVMQWNQEDYGSWVLYLAPVVAPFLAMRFSAERWSPRTQLVVITGLWGLAHILIFRDGAFVHDYWQFYLLPFVSLSIAWTAVMFIRARVTQPSARITAYITLVVVALLVNLPGIIYLFSRDGKFVVTPVFDIWR